MFTPDQRERLLKHESKMSMAIWAPASWELMHGASFLPTGHKQKHEANDLYWRTEFITALCSMLACPRCDYHAKKYMEANPLNKLTSLEALQRWVFEFHNDVNVRVHVPLYAWDDLCAQYAPGSKKASETVWPGKNLWTVLYACAFGMRGKRKQDGASPDPMGRLVVALGHMLPRGRARWTDFVRNTGSRFGHQRAEVVRRLRDLHVAVSGGAGSPPPPTFVELLDQYASPRMYSTLRLSAAQKEAHRARYERRIAALERVRQEVMLEEPAERKELRVRFAKEWDEAVAQQAESEEERASWTAATAKAKPKAGQLTGSGNRRHPPWLAPVVGVSLMLVVALVAWLALWFARGANVLPYSKAAVLFGLLRPGPSHVAAAGKLSGVRSAGGGGAGGGVS